MGLAKFFVKFGFPLDLKENGKLSSDKINHASPEKVPDHIEHYLKTETKHDAILGQFDKPPIELHTSAFLTGV